MRDVANAAADAPDADPPGPADLLLDGLAAYLTGDRAAGAAILRQALSGFRDGMTGAEELRWLPLARAVALYLWDDAAWDNLSGRCATLARDAGALGELPVALDSLACLHLLRGELSTAESLTAQARAVAEATGSRPTVTGALGVAAIRGDRDLALTLIDGATRDAALRDEGLAVAAARWATAVLHNGLGQYAAALAAAEESLRYAGTAPLAGWAAAELVEAATRSGQPELAAEAMRGLSRSPAPRAPAGPSASRRARSRC